MVLNFHLIDHISVLLLNLLSRENVRVARPPSFLSQMLFPPPTKNPAVAIAIGVEFCPSKIS